MRNTKAVYAVLGAAALILAAVACTNGEAATSVEPQQPQTVAPVRTGPVLPSETANPLAGSPSVRGTPQLQTTGGNTGIWVSGEGSLTMVPDVAKLDLGVEATGKTVAIARGQAATAMAAMIASLKGNAVADTDIQTRSFNIAPQYQWTEVVQNGARTNKQVLVGYTVTNTAAVKIRDMDSVGPILDDVAAAGGDATRINGIRFTVDDTSPLTNQLREEAVADAMDKASQFAALTGVGLGRLMFISESGSGEPQVRAYPEAEYGRALAVAAPPTGISGGELEISMRVQAVFAIAE